MTPRIVLLFSVLALGASAIRADVVSETGTQTYAINLPPAFGPQINLASVDYYGSGNDDANAEYGLTTFNLGGAFAGTVTGISSVELTLTVNDRFFSDGDAVEVFFTTDSGADLDIGNGVFSGIFFNNALVNGIDGSQFNFAPVSLGVFSIPEMAGRAGGETDVLTLNFGTNVSALIDAINNGTDFQILLGATNSTHDITYSGVGNSFDPGDPLLTINATVVPVPEPASATILGAVALAGFTMRRRRG